MDTQSGRISHVNYMWRDRGEQGVIWVQPQFLEPLAAPPHSRRSLKSELCEILGTSGTSREELEEWKQGGISRLVWWSGVTGGLYFWDCMREERKGKAGKQNSALSSSFHSFLALIMSHSWLHHACNEPVETQWRTVQLEFTGRLEWNVSRTTTCWGIWFELASAKGHRFFRKQCHLFKNKLGISIRYVR